ncbi:hypothetical protein KTT_09950 [Tengunoibacter tsumagoiensis]|uniref:Uncharacterized protein n=1 Tax=Tengunoibacter tsumagoiensis TaxID=2014871 RepID=A0A401ZWF0_9CHLR|nr:hypothetical protein KTT_09950 [Tengunoibacter tsumagoiensis]
MPKSHFRMYNSRARKSRAGNPIQTVVTVGQLCIMLMRQEPFMGELRSGIAPVCVPGKKDVHPKYMHRLHRADGYDYGRERNA